MVKRTKTMAETIKDG
jgi:hypothetical protein